MENHGGRAKQFARPHLIIDAVRTREPGRAQILNIKERLTIIYHHFPYCVSLRVKTSHQFTSQNQPVIGMVLGGFFGRVGTWIRFAGLAGFGFLGR